MRVYKELFDSSFEVEVSISSARDEVNPKTLPRGGQIESPKKARIEEPEP